MDGGSSARNSKSYNFEVEDIEEEQSDSIYDNASDSYSDDDSNNDYEGDSDHRASHNGSNQNYEEYIHYKNLLKLKLSSDMKQHIAALVIAFLAAIITHAQTYPSFSAWKADLAQDWNNLQALIGRTVKMDSAGGNSDALFVSTWSNDQSGSAPRIAPSVIAIPNAQRTHAVKRVLFDENETSYDDEERERMALGHVLAKDYRRTAGLRFCLAEETLIEGTVTDMDQYHLADMEFILPLEPSVRILQSYFLADAFHTDSSFADYQYTSDAILRDIDSLNQKNNSDIGLSLQQIHSILQPHLPISHYNLHHACLLQQYTQNKRSGRSIRGTTKVYDRPHISSFYRNKNHITYSNEVATKASFLKEDLKIVPASLTFSGFATKFINLSLNTLNLYWDGGLISSGSKAGQTHLVLVGAIPSMESIGTASFPGHSFFVTPTYDREHVLQRWTVTADEPILYYDPLENLAVEEQKRKVEHLHHTGKWTLKQKLAWEAWVVNRSFARDYLIKTGRAWLSMFPQPYLHGDNFETNDISHENHHSQIATAITKREDYRINNRGMFMWSADYIGQVHKIKTSNLYFTVLPSPLTMLTKNDYSPEVEKQRHLVMQNFQSSQIAGNAISTNSSLPLSLKVLSCAPRVFEVKKFLSPIEVQHLINLASGAEGNVSMQRSTVLASHAMDSRGSAKLDTRSSTGGWIHREQDSIVDTIFRRVADLLKIDERLMRDASSSFVDSTKEETEPLPIKDRIVEAMQLLRYGPGEEYTPHHDFTYPSIENRYQPKRYATVLLYLTGEGDVVENGIRHSSPSKLQRSHDIKADPLEGGETIFPRAITKEYHDGLKVTPQSGKAVIFYNVLPDGNMDDLSQHSGRKVMAGVKYLANIWIWDPIIN